MIPKVVLVYILVIIIAFLFFVKFNVQKLNKELILIESEIAKEKENIHMLRAELTHLSQPQLIEKLASKYLDLQPMDRHQLVIVTFPDKLMQKERQQK